MSYLTKEELEEKIRKEGFSINNILKHHAYQNKPLDFDQAYILGAFTLSPYIEELQELFDFPREKILVQSIAALCALHNTAIYAKEKSSEQIAGICAAVFDYDIGTSKGKFLHPKSRNVMDNCGMGGDLFRTPNLSSIAAIIAAADGITMLKHGSPGNTDEIGSSDFFFYCGVNLFQDKEVVEEGTEIFHFGYTDAVDENYKRIHRQTHSYAKLAHMNDIIGPITNPVDPTYITKRVLGVNNLIPTERVAQAYTILNRKGITHVEHVLFVRGFSTPKREGGIDEVSNMSGGTIVTELYHGEIKTYDVFARDFGLQEITSGELHPGENKAETSRRILRGEITDGRRDAALANAAILFYLAQGLDFKEGTDKARKILSSGKPYQLLQDYAKYSHRRAK